MSLIELLQFLNVKQERFFFYTFISPQKCFLRSQNWRCFREYSHHFVLIIFFPHEAFDTPEVRWISSINGLCARLCLRACVYIRMNMHNFTYTEHVCLPTEGFLNARLNRTAAHWWKSDIICRPAAAVFSAVVTNGTAIKKKTTCIIQIVNTCAGAGFHIRAQVRFNLYIVYTTGPVRTCSCRDRRKQPPDFDGRLNAGDPYYYYYYYYSLQLSVHSVAVVRTLVQTKQTRINTRVDPKFSGLRL